MRSSTVGRQAVVPAILAAAAFASAARGQLTNPLPEPSSSGISVEVEPWLTIPSSSGGNPATRIAHLKPCPDGERLFCNDQRGKLWAIAGVGASSATEFLDLDDYVPGFIDSPGLGTGFASFAFHPEFVLSGAPGFGKFYTAHVEDASGGADFSGPVSPGASQHAVVLEWTMADPRAVAISAGDGTTRRELLRVEFPYHFHGMQEIAFRPGVAPGDEDYGCLFICVGDGGSIVVDLPGNIGRPDSALGSILRVVPLLALGQEGGVGYQLGANGEYFIPDSNPFRAAADPTPGDGAGVVEEIYAYGFRNPHRISWDPGGSGKMFCGNIGESNIEEVELVEKGGHYGWPEREGSYRFDPDDRPHVYPLPSPDTGPPGSPPAPGSFAYPAAHYDHGNGRSAVAGGFVYRGAAVPDLAGYYVCGDIVEGVVYLVPESDMVLEAPGSSGAAPADLRTLGLRSGGTATDMKSLVGASRVDLRIGTDHAGELYLLSKRNGTVYRVLAAGGGGEPPVPDGGRDDWEKVDDFEDGAAALAEYQTDGGAGGARVADDPVAGPCNQVLELSRGDDSGVTDFYRTMPQIADGATGTIYFRMFFEGQDHNHNWGASDVASPSEYPDFEVQLRSWRDDPGRLQTRDGGSFEGAADVAAGEWFQVWMVAENRQGTGADVFAVYLQGGRYEAPTLVRGGNGFRNGTGGSLRTLFWRIRGADAIYFDDIHVDVGHRNLSSPLLPAWLKVADFEGEGDAALEGWEFPDAGAQSNTVVEEPGGNRYLERRASADGSPNSRAVAYRRLPFDVQVSETVTFYCRILTAGTSLYQTLGLTAEDTAEPELLDETDFEPQLRVSAADPQGVLEVYDGPGGASGFVHPVDAGTGAPVAPLADGEWTELWIVANNAGFASGGQTYDVYARGGGRWRRQTRLGGTTFFRREAEAPITHFLAVASTVESPGAGSGNDALGIDDLYVFPGENLESPTARVFSQARLTIDDGGAGDATIRFDTEVGYHYQVWRSAGFGEWVPVGGEIHGDGAGATVTEPQAGRAFYVVERLGACSTVDR